MKEPTVEAIFDFLDATAFVAPFLDPCVYCNVLDAYHSGVKMAFLVRQGMTWACVDCLDKIVEKPGVCVLCEENLPCRRFTRIRANAFDYGKSLLACKRCVQRMKEELEGWFVVKAVTG